MKTGLLTLLSSIKQEIATSAAPPRNDKMRNYC
jgi:hypothetical protein